jgi:hypothetical protein
MAKRTTKRRQGSTSDVLIRIHTPTKPHSINAVCSATKTEVIEEYRRERERTKYRVAE